MADIFKNIDIHSLFDKSTTLGQIIELLIYIVIAAVATTIILLVYNRFVNKKLKDKKNIQIRFTQNIIRTLIILGAVIWVLVSSTATTDIGKVLFQGTAIIGAVAGLAAQPVLGDLFSGFALTFNKPFEIGDRIELDNGIAGVVKDITPRHVILLGLDSVEIIVPNSKINGMIITDTSHGKIRSVQMRFSVAYGTDIEKAIEVVRNVIIASDFTVPGWKNDDYGPVYFISFADSSLVLATTVYFNQNTSIALVTSDINKKVNDAFAKEGIEIPFNYVNVVMKKED